MAEMAAGEVLNMHKAGEHRGGTAHGAAATRPPTIRRHTSGNTTRMGGIQESPTPESECSAHGYQLLRLLGRGNFGSVHLAENMQLNAASGFLGETDDEEGEDNLCVIKIAINRAAKPGSHIEALQEARVLRKLRHPCIVQFMDSFLSADHHTLYIAMEYCDSGVLADRIDEAIEDQQWLEEERIMGWFSQLCSALDFLHRNHILHRDIKPDNVFMAHNGEFVKLGDFGFTRVLDNTNALAHTKCGTPFYMSPEQCMGHAYNAKADAWASGVVLYQLVTLQLPFTGKNLPELRRNILGMAPKRPPTHYSKALCSLMLALLQRTPDKRPTLGEVLIRPIVRDALSKFVEKHGKQGMSLSTRVSDSNTNSALRARVPSFAETGTGVNMDPRAALRRKQKIQLELVSQQKRLSDMQSQRRSSQKRMRQSTPTRASQRYNKHSEDSDIGLVSGERSHGRQTRYSERAFVVAKGMVDGVSDGTVIVQGGGGRKFRARMGDTQGARQDIAENRNGVDSLGFTMGSTRPPKLKKFRSTSPLNSTPGSRREDKAGGAGSNMMELDDGGAEMRALTASIENLKGQLVDINHNIRHQKHAVHGEVRLQNAACELAQSLESIGVFGRNSTAHQSSDSMVLRSIDSDPYSSDTFEKDDEDQGSGSSRLSDIGRSMMQIGLDDSVDLDNKLRKSESEPYGESRDVFAGRGSAVRLSRELPGGSQLVHMSATPSGVMDDGRGEASKQSDHRYSRK